MFNLLIGNCDAHSKNFSLLYDASVPTLAPLYDLVSTTVYPELTTRLAMSLDGARPIEEVTRSAWARLPRESLYSERFASGEVAGLVAGVLDVMDTLMAQAGHDNQTAETVAAGVRSRAGALAGSG